MGSISYSVPYKAETLRKRHSTQHTALGFTAGAQIVHPKGLFEGNLRPSIN